MLSLPQLRPNRYRLVGEILARSTAGSWREASQEWFLGGVFFTAPESPGTCLCGHFPIIESCLLRNRENGNQVIVGNVCVRRFLGLPAEELFAPLRRIMVNRDAALNLQALQYALRLGWLSEWEGAFYHDMLRKRKLSAKQRAKRAEINLKVLTRMAAGREVSHAP